jgi:flagellar motor switch protein FliM
LASRAQEPEPAAAANLRALAERLERLGRTSDTGAADPAAQLLRRVRALHAGCATRLAAALSARLRSPVDVRLNSVDRIGFGAFLLNHDRAMCCIPLRSATHDRGLALEIDLAVLYPLIHRLLGGELDSDSVPDRPLSEVEKRLTERIAEVVLGELQTSWERLLPLPWSVDRVESQVSLADGLSAREIICTIRFQLQLGAARGDLLAVVPWSLLEGIDDSSWQHAVDGVEPAAGSPDAVELTVGWPEVDLPAEDIQNLQVGDIITTDRTSDDLLEVKLNGVTQFRARPGTLDGHRAIRLE